MSITAGTLSQLSVSSNSASLAATAATGGTAPYTYQWYRSTTSGFTPGGGNIITGATALSLSDTGLIPNTPYFYTVVATDSAAASIEYTQLAVTTGGLVQSPNSFGMSPTLGQVDQAFNFNTTPVQVDASQNKPMYAGSAVKMVNSADGVPKVVACAANSDECIGFINFDIKSVQFVAGSAAEISQSGNVIYLYATAAVARGAQVQLDTSSPGGVAPLTGSSGANIVGYAMDQAASSGQLIRVKLSTPSFLFA